MDFKKRIRKKIIITLLEGEEEWARSRPGLSHKCPQEQGMEKSEARAQMSTWVSHMGGWGPHNCPTSVCYPECASIESWIGITGTGIRILIWDGASQGTSYTWSQKVFEPTNLKSLHSQGLWFNFPPFFCFLKFHIYIKVIRIIFLFLMLIYLPLRVKKLQHLINFFLLVSFGTISLSLYHAPRSIQKVNVKMHIFL